ncbi:ABC transporter substrate-binding protein [Olsenella profusa]|uniref:NMT1/THI5-like protein n=1 Tax=Olsenella profusa F0195 TaxID=1125712 RepID=U2UVK9_9ACTN|nr:ABC transporter substrate-binding protein [Olsenella profusa]ERL07152.1 NMT1/THI5-like protein [Olsenella profusa F0195]
MPHDLSGSLTRRSFFGDLAAVGAGLALGACNNSEANAPTPANSAAHDLEVDTIHWGRANSGNIFVTLAQQKGYFADEGLTVVEDPVQNDTDAMTALGSGAIDITSNQGTSGPLKQMVTGQDFTFVGGYMLQGMYLIAKKGTTWNGIDDLVGKRVAHKAPQIPVCYALIQAGYDPNEVVTWVSTNTSADRLAAVVAGEADYGYMSGDMLYTVNNSDDVDIVVYADELMSEYGCCRMDMRTDFVKSNPKTMRALMRAMVRANAYFQANIDECVTILAKELNTNEEYVAAYLKNEHYRPDIDPVKHKIEDTYEVMQKIDLVSDEEAANFKLEDHIDTSFYENALKEISEEHADEYPEWWASRKEFFENQNK